MAKSATRQLGICLANEGYEVSLERWKIYFMLCDATAEKHGLVRIIDESHEDYLYPKAMFQTVELPQRVRRAMLAAA